MAAEMPQETRDKISAALRKAWQSPAVQNRMRNRFTPAKLAVLSRNRREYWAELRADPVRSAEYRAKLSAATKEGKARSKARRREASDAAQG